MKHLYGATYVRGASDTGVSLSPLTNMEVFRHLQNNSLLIKWYIRKRSLEDWGTLFQFHSSVTPEPNTFASEG